MSQENVEVVRANFEAWNAGDVEAWGERFDPDAIMRNPDGWPEPGPQVGREAVLRFIMQLRDTWDADALEVISDFTDVGDRVAVRFVWHGAGRGPQAWDCRNATLTPTPEATGILRGRCRRRT